MSDRINIDLKDTKDEVFWASVTERSGRPVLVPHNQAAWLISLGKMVNEMVAVRIERKKRGHSDEQRGYYRGVVLVDVLAGLRALAVEVGEECPIKNTDHLHEFFKALFLPQILGPVVVELPGANASVEMWPTTTTVLTTAEYTTYLDLINKFAADRKIPVRAPGEEFVA
jgi:hypothetical protein